MAHPSGPALPVAIQALHAAIAQHPDPQSKQVLSQCLQNMLKVQAQDMNPQQGQAGGGQVPQGPAPGPPQQNTPPPQIQALLGQLGH
jgi:hypothetical protein